MVLSLDGILLHTVQREIPPLTESVAFPAKAGMSTQFHEASNIWTWHGLPHCMMAGPQNGGEEADSSLKD